MTTSSIVKSVVSTLDVLVTAWDWEPSVLAGCAGLALIYAWILRQHRSSEPGSIWPRAVCGLTGIAVLLLALVSPLDTLGDDYLFSAHMLQHLLLVLIVPLFLLLGIPPSFYERALAIPQFNRVARMLTHPAVAWTLGVGTLWVWHLPVLYDGTLTNDALHIFEHLCFLVTATIFWAPTLVSALDYHLSPIGVTVYLMGAGFANCLLGVLIAFAPAVLYPTYLHPVDALGILPLLQGQWGLDPQSDQQAAGMMMWVPGSFPYIVATFAILARWFIAGDAVTDLTPAPSLPGKGAAAAADLTPLPPSPQEKEAIRTQ